MFIKRVLMVRIAIFLLELEYDTYILIIFSALKTNLWLKFARTAIY